MFLFSVIFGVTLGLILKGKISKLRSVRIRKFYLILIALVIKVIVKLLVNFGILEIGMLTYGLDVLTYVILLGFVLMNRKNIFIVLMGVGFALNAIAILTNGGVMPVSQGVMNSVSKDAAPSNFGLYMQMTDGVNFKYLCDTIYFGFLGPFVFSVGDIVSGIGLTLFIVAGMKGRYGKMDSIHHRGRSSRKSRRLRQGRSKYAKDNVPS